MAETDAERELQAFRAAHLGEIGATFRAFHARLDGLLHTAQGRFQELEWRSEGQDLSPTERVEAFYGALDGLRDDRLDYQDTNLDAMLDRYDDVTQSLEEQLRRMDARMDALEQAQHQDHSHDQGMSY